MRDARMREEERTLPPGGPEAADCVLPDFTCNTCGRSSYGAKEPVHCVKCGGIHFTPRPEVLRDGVLGIADVTRRMIADAQGVLQAMRRVNYVSERCRQKMENAERNLHWVLSELYVNEHAKRPEIRMAEARKKLGEGR